MKDFTQDGDEGLIFAGPDDGPLRNTNFNRRVWSQALVDAGLPLHAGSWSLNTDEIRLTLLVQDYVRRETPLAERMSKHGGLGISGVVRLTAPRCDFQQGEQLGEWT
ncbi:hypothetical protein [Streptosporangium minutum]|uniref:hypothetical protein n=1 Tax=Streptosporangium minutum TaxID=569862 RepID=UPI0013FD151F|nr:hypothetical protein [Streptosporangium minutum]